MNGQYSSALGRIRQLAKTFYNSGHVTQDGVSISLPSDLATYYVVFSNKAAFLTPRAVEASIDLNYWIGRGVEEESLRAVLAALEPASHRYRT